MSNILNIWDPKKKKYVPLPSISGVPGVSPVVEFTKDENGDSAIIITDAEGSKQTTLVSHAEIESAVSAEVADEVSRLEDEYIGKPGGVASLDENGKLPEEQLPISSLLGNLELIYSATFDKITSGETAHLAAIDIAGEAFGLKEVIIEIQGIDCSGLGISLCHGEDKASLWQISESTARSYRYLTVGAKERNGFWVPFLPQFDSISVQSTDSPKIAWIYQSQVPVTGVEITYSADGSNEAGGGDLRIYGVRAANAEGSSIE